MNADDIVKRLREYAKHCDGVHSCWNDTTLLAAADMIESLQSELAKWKEQYKQTALNWQQENAECRKLQVDVAEAETLIERFNATLNREGFDNIETMIAKYKTVILAANEISIETDEEIEKLKAQLTESKRRERAAVESWRGFCAKCDWRGRMWLSDGQPDGRCKTCRDNNKCNWQWRGPQEAGKGSAE